MRAVHTFLIVGLLGGRAFAAEPVPLAPSGTPWRPAEIAALGNAIDRRLASPALRGAHLAFYAIDTTRGTLLYARAPDEAFVPASTLKLITGSAALDRLGPDFRFYTSVLATAIEGDTVRGDLIVRAGGDPLLRASDLDAAAAAVAARGIRAISGGIVFDVSAFDDVPYPPGWMIEDIPYDFSAISSALMLEENTVTLHVVAGTAVGVPASIGLTPPTNAVTIEDDVTTGPAGSAERLDLARDGSAIRLFGSIPLGTDETLAAAVPDPLAYAADVFARALAAHGVALGRPPAGPPRLVITPPEATLVWSHPSDSLTALLRWFWFRSDNLVGETLLKAIGLAAHGPPGTSRDGIASETAYLRRAGVDPATLAIVDGSGLSRYDAVTPRAYVQVLQAAWNGPNRSIILDALPVAGVRGSLRTAYTGVAGRLYAKSGSMTHVWNLAGFIMTRRHGPVTFAFMCDDFVGSIDALRAVQEDVFEQIVEG